VSFLRHKNAIGAERAVLAVLCVSVCLFVAGCNTTQQETTVADAEILSKGSVFMKRTKTYKMPPAEELEDRIRRVVQTSIAEEDPVEDAIRNIVKQTVAEDESEIAGKIRMLAKQEVESSADYIARIARENDLSEEQIRLLATQVFDGSEDKIIATAEQVFKKSEPTMRSIAENTFLSSGDQIEAFAKKAVLDSEDYIRLVANNSLKDSEAYIVDIARRNNMTPAQVRQVAHEAFDGLREDVRAIAQSTVLGSSEQMQAFAKQALLESEGYIADIAKRNDMTQDQVKQVASEVFQSSEDSIRLFAKEEITNSEDYIRELAEETVAEFKAPTDDFAIKAIVKEVIEEEKRSASLGGVGVANLDGVPSPNGDVVDIIPLNKYNDPTKWVHLKDYHVVVHEDGTKLRDIMKKVMTKAEPFVGPWQVKWKLKKENADVLNERFSLDAETTFVAFADYISDFLRRYRGFSIDFRIFEEERILVITD
jgi:hypothetical protein